MNITKYEFIILYKGNKKVIFRFIIQKDFFRDTERLKKRFRKETTIIEWNW